MSGKFVQCCPATQLGCERTGHKVVLTAPEYINITRVTDWHRSGGAPVDASGKEPYPRPASPYPSAVDCPADDICGNMDDTVNNHPPCGLWRELNSNADPDHGTLGVGGVWSASSDRNVYQATGNNLTLGQDAVGFKSLQAKKQWHGRPDLTGAQNQPPTGWYLNDATYKYVTLCYGELGVEGQTKYLTQRFTASVDAFHNYSAGAGDASHITSAEARQTSVGRYTGVITLDECSLGAVISGGDGLFDTAAIYGLVWNANLTTLAGLHAAKINEWCAAYQTHGLPVTVTGNVWRFENIAEDSTVYYIEITLDIAGGYFAFRSFLPGHDSLLQEYTVTATQINYSFSYSSPASPYGELNGTGSAVLHLSNPYTSAQVLTDCRTLLSEWNLHDDFQYPWRTDGYLSCAPQVCYAEVPSNVSPNADINCSWTDPHASQGYDGTIMGRPSGFPGALTFSWDHKTWDVCGTGGGTLFIYNYGRFAGATNAKDPTDHEMPKQATRWTENRDCGYLRPGRFIITGSPAANGGMIIQDWRELAQLRKRTDWSRPCGLDQYTMIESSIRCIIDDPSGDYSSMTFPLADTYSGSVGDAIVVLGPGAAYGSGTWVVTAIASDSITASRTGDLPADFTYSEGGPLIGKIRWPSYDFSQPCNPTFSNTNPAARAIRHAWTFNFRDVGERNRVIALADPNCPAAGGPIRATQAARGLDATVENYYSYPIDSGNWDITDCQRVIVPMPFPDSVIFDEWYSSCWFSTIQQWMVDPFYQAPHVRCDIVQGNVDLDGLAPYEWSEDGYDGIYCHETRIVPDSDPPKTQYFYPQRQWVEAELTGPAGSHTLPPDVVVGYYSISEMNGATWPPTGRNAYVPVPPTISMANAAHPNSEHTPWSIFLGECGCITGGLPFGNDYQKEMTCTSVT